MGGDLRDELTSVVRMISLDDVSRFLHHNGIALMMMEFDQSAMKWL